MRKLQPAPVIGSATLSITLLLLLGFSTPVASAPLPRVRVRFGANAAEPSIHGRIVIQAEFPQGATLPASLTVSYDVDAARSTAIASSDYEPLSGSVVLTADMLWTGVIDVTPIDDGISEGDEEIVIRLKEDSHYTPDTRWPSGTVHLADDEQAPPAPRSWFVATTGNDTLPNDGSLSQPFRTLPYAMRQARYGDTIYMRGGDYREAVNLDATGVGQFFQTLPVLETSVGSWSNMLTIQSYNNEEVFIKGSDVNGT